MIWRVEFTDRAKKSLNKLDYSLQTDILKYLRNRIQTDEDPRRFGEPLGYEKAGFWRYRIRKVRVVCDILDDDQTVRITHVGLRKIVYGGH